MDGCGELRIFWSVVLPLMKPALGTLGLITFINAWNNFVNPLVVMRSVEQLHVAAGLRSMQSPTTPSGAR
jgi:multiple sugar transport system permease protein